MEPFISPTIPLVVDLDHTLIGCDTSLVLARLHLKTQPLGALFQLGYWFLIKGRAYCKNQLVQRYGTDFDMSALPYTALRMEALYCNAPIKALVSGSEHRLVARIAQYLGGFSLAKGSTLQCNLIGEKKANFLRKQYPQGYDYIGDSMADIKVWAHARKAYGYNVSKRVIRHAQQAGIKLEIIKAL